MTIIHYDFDNLEYTILISSFDEYKSNGGPRDMFDAYSRIKEMAKQHESNYIQLMDMSLSGIDVNDKQINKEALEAQALWHLLSLWFNKPKRKVSYRNFDLTEFNKL